MRPRQACLGMPGHAPIVGVDHQQRFNEAEASLPRNAPRSHTLRRPPFPGFNEAEASLPRNADIRKRMIVIKTSGFNEAEASLPRNANCDNSDKPTQSSLQ